jgi:hypothetical protein
MLQHSAFKSILIVASLALNACALDSAPAAPVTIDGDPPAAEPVVYPTVPVVVEAPPEKKGTKLPPIRYWISPSVHEREGVEAAFAAWQQATQSVRDWVEVPADASIDDVFPDEPTKHPSLADVVVLEIGPYGNTCGEGGTTGALGCVVGIGGLWHNESGDPMVAFMIDTTFSDDGHAEPGYQQYPKLVAMHEVGHLLGLTHQGGGEMMHPTNAELALDWECPDPDSVDALEQKLDVTGLSSCAVPTE